MKLFLDSGAFIARARKDDPYHEAATAAFASIARGDLPYPLRYTSNYVVDETSTFLLYEAGPRVAVEVLRAIRASPNLVVLHVSEDVGAAADEVFARFAPSGVSYTDCTTKVLMDRESIEVAFSFDKDLETLGFRRIRDARRVPQKGVPISVLPRSAFGAAGGSMRLAATTAVALLLGTALFAFVPPARAPGTPLILNVGDLGEMRTRNVLNTTLSMAPEGDIGAGILRPVYSNPLISSPGTGLTPYIAKGVDADGDGVFEAGEYGTFQKNAGANQTDITVYLDFNGVRWHDGVQMDAMDLFFSLEVAALNPRYDSPLLPLMDLGGAPGSNFTADRWLAVGLAAKDWAGEASMAGDPALRVAVRFRLHTPYAQFYESTLGGLWLLPRHVWEGTGGGRHADFGLAVYPRGDPRAGQGVPVSGTPYNAFDIATALRWEPRDEDVIGAGPFRFTAWAGGQYEQLDRNALYFVGADPADPSVVYDRRLGPYTHPPFVDRIVFRPYRTLQLAVLALQSGEADYLRFRLPPEYVPDLLNDPRIRVWAGAETGFTYLAYNLRKLPFGYSAFPPPNATSDVGRPFRLAMGHLIDKATMVRTYLQNFGFVANGPVSPANTFWYNSSLPSNVYDPALAAAILDNAGWTVGPGGWRVLPRIGQAQIRVLVPASGFDPIIPENALLVATAARGVGLNITQYPVPFGALTDAVSTGDFDMAVLGASNLGVDPDYLYPLFHCRGGTGPPNIPGYCDPEYDRVIEASRTEMDRTRRQRLVWWAQGILMEDRPIEPLYILTRIEAQRSDRFVNWSVSDGTLWDYGSWIGIRPPGSEPRWHFSIAAPSAVASGARAQISVTVFDDRSDPVSGASVTLRTVQANAGTFVGSSGPQVTGTTGAAGTFTATYEAPTVTPPFLDVAIEATVTHPTLSAALWRSVIITVYPMTSQFLSLRTSLPAGDVTFAGGAIPMRIEVLDQTGAPVTDALVNATVSPGNATLSRTTGTAQEMASIVFTPPTELGATVSYRVSLAATKAGYYPARANVSLLVMPEGTTPPPPPTPFPPALDSVLVAGLATALVAVAAIVLLALRRRRRPRT